MQEKKIYYHIEGNRLLYEFSFLRSGFCQVIFVDERFF